MKKRKKRIEKKVKRREAKLNDKLCRGFVHYEDFKRVEE